MFKSIEYNTQRSINKENNYQSQNFFIKLIIENCNGCCCFEINAHNIEFYSYLKYQHLQKHAHSPVHKKEEKKKIQP